MWCKGSAHMQEWKHKENMKAKSESIACNNNEVWPSQTVKFCKARVEAAAFCGPNKKQPSPFSLSLFLTIYAGRELLSSGQRRSSKTRRGRRGRGRGARRVDFCNLRRIHLESQILAKMYIMASFRRGKKEAFLQGAKKKMHRGISFYQGIVSF